MSSTVAHAHTLSAHTWNLTGSTEEWHCLEGAAPAKTGISLVNLALKRLRQAGQEFKARLGEEARLCLLKKKRGGGGLKLESHYSLHKDMHAQPGSH